MSYAATSWTILIVAVLAAVVTAFVQNWIAVDLRRRHHDVGSVVFLQLGVVFGVLLAFVFSEAWGEYNEAALAIDLEVSAMHGTAVIAATLPPAYADSILSAEQAYLQSVVDDEWPVLAAHRTENINTDRKLEALVARAANLQLNAAGEQDKKASLLSLLGKAHEQRETRIFQADSGIPGALWCVLISLTVVLTLFVAFAAIQYMAIAIIISVCFAAGIVAILVMARLLDYPFEGALALEPTDFSSVIEKVSYLRSHLNGG